MPNACLLRINYEFRVGTNYAIYIGSAYDFFRLKLLFFNTKIACLRMFPSGAACTVMVRADKSFSVCVVIFHFSVR